MGSPSSPAAAKDADHLRDQVQRTVAAGEPAPCNGLTPAQTTLIISKVQPSGCLSLPAG